MTPGIRDYGEFTVTLGNTLWKLHDVYFDSPDPNGAEGHKLTEEPLDESAGECPAPAKGTAVTSSQAVMEGSYGVVSSSFAQYQEAAALG